MPKEYIWPNAQAWIRDKIHNEWGNEEVATEFVHLLARLSDAAIEEHWADEMEQDGYYEKVEVE